MTTAHLGDHVRIDGYGDRHWRVIATTPTHVKCLDLGAEPRRTLTVTRDKIAHI